MPCREEIVDAEFYYFRAMTNNTATISSFLCFGSSMGIVEITQFGEILHMKNSMLG